MSFLNPILWKFSVSTQWRKQVLFYDQFTKYWYVSLEIDMFNPRFTIHKDKLDEARDVITKRYNSNEWTRIRDKRDKTKHNGR